MCFLDVPVPEVEFERNWERWWAAFGELRATVSFSTEKEVEESVWASLWGRGA